LILRAGELDLYPYGLSFHVGRQQTTTHAYEVAAMLFTDLTEARINLRVLNLSGGFPTRYREAVPEINQFGDAIMAAMTLGIDLRRPGGGAVGRRLCDDLRQNKVQRLRAVGRILRVTTFSLRFSRARRG
jgi:Pyridoxal-dependent decarboxylase, pyridoxal binding domain